MKKRKALSSNLFRIFADDERYLKALAKRQELTIYVPKPADRLIKIMQDENAVFYIERRRMRRICKSAFAIFEPAIAVYFETIYAFVKTHVFVDWVKCLANCETGKLYDTITEDFILDDSRKMSWKTDAGVMIALAKQFILKTSLLAGAIVVYDKEADVFADKLLIKRVRVTSRKTTGLKYAKLMLPSGNVVLGI